LAGKLEDEAEDAATLTIDFLKPVTQIAAKNPMN
jgi:hypothetical protein